MCEKVRLSLTNALMVLGQIVFTMTLSRQVYYTSGNNNDFGVLFLVGWVVLCLTTLSSMFLYHIDSKKVSFKLYLTSVVFLVMEACLVLVRYLQSNNSRILLICALLVQLMYLSYVYTNVMFHERKKA